MKAIALINQSIRSKKVVHHSMGWGKKKDSQEEVSLYSRSSSVNNNNAKNLARTSPTLSEEEKMMSQAGLVNLRINQMESGLKERSMMCE